MKKSVNRMEKQAVFTKEEFRLITHFLAIAKLIYRACKTTLPEDLVKEVHELNFVWFYPEWEG